MTMAEAIDCEVDCNCPAPIDVAVSAPGESGEYELMNVDNYTTL